MSDTRVDPRVREIRDALGLPFVLRPTWSIDKAMISPDSVTVVIDFYTTRQTKSRLYYTGKGVKLMSWRARYDFTSLDEMRPGERLVGGRWFYAEVTLMDPDFEPFSDHLMGRIETPAEYHARRAWEAMQYRVGTHKSPMDNCDRTLEGHTTAAMTNHWK